MKEISEILKAYAAARKAGKKTALATVVKVEGSSYRQPGARMLVTEDGLLTGAISGGCLEGDALRKALLSIDQQQNKLITYNTTNEDESEVGLQLGCNGIVHILFEYIDDAQINNPIQLLQELEKERKAAVILTVFSLKRQAVQIGTVLFYRENAETLSTHEIANTLLSNAEQVLQTKTTLIKKLDDTNNNEALLEHINPPISLIIAGAGNDVQPLVQMAAIVGWQITVGDGRSTHATPVRFPKAKTVKVVKPDQFLDGITVDDQTYFVLMTHNYKYDLELLKILITTNCGYIGLLGPKTKLSRMLDDLEAIGINVTNEQLEKIYGPVGLDIGAETSEEIALSVVAEIKAVIESKKGTSLKYKTGKIHSIVSYDN